MCDFFHSLASAVRRNKKIGNLEKSCILVDKGVFYGMGYLAPHQIPVSVTKAKEILKPYPSYQFIENLVADYAINNPDKLTLLNT